jgi:hypothetical protein
MIKKLEDIEVFVEVFDPIVRARNDWRVTLRWDGEGLWGRFSRVPSDEDRQMLRFLIEKRDGRNWSVFGTNTTYLLASDPRDVLEAAAEIIIDRCVAEAAKKKPEPLLVQKLSYIHLTPKGPAIDVPVDSDCKSF